MSVYTPLSRQQMSALLADYGFQLVDFRGASHGIENSTFLIEARDPQGQPSPLVLTVFETLEPDALTPYLELLAQLADHEHLPVPAPLPAPDGQWQCRVANKAAVLMPRLPGDHDFAVDAHRCRQVGALLARLHQCPVNTLAPLPGERERLAGLTEQLRHLPDQWQNAARECLTSWQATPAGQTLIHGDLFRDNLLWQDGQISALLDFYNACLDHPEYDLAVTLNDWCVDEAGKPVAARQTALLDAYREQGETVDDARLTLALQVAALRFWLSRLAGPVAEQSEGQGSKDPAEFARIFAWRTRGLD
ncbi:MAG: phosphotransferase [Pseudomonadota bacterium]|nr:phosphotransferase [Pseudomonadota bacterium]MEE2871146.1 phosphotransferase [Pseudomonadota bacterium]